MFPAATSASAAWAPSYQALQRELQLEDPEARLADLLPFLRWRVLSATKSSNLCSACFFGRL